MRAVGFFPTGEIMAPGYGDSYTVWCSPTPGTIRWPFTFKDNYIDRKFVKVRYKPHGVHAWVDVAINTRTNFESDYVLKIEPPIPPCEMLEIYRDTPKDKPIVVYGFGGQLLAKETRSAAARQSMHVVVELKEAKNRLDLECKCECALNAV